MDVSPANPHRPTLLIVDDDPLIAETLTFALGKDFLISQSDSREHCVRLLRQMDTPPNLALVDLGLPPQPHRPDEGFALIGELLAHSPDMRIVVLSGQNEEVHGRHARALGATEFVAKPCDPGRLKEILRKVLAFDAERASGEALIGNSASMQKLKAQIRQYADSPFPVLIEGESGSGKEIVANISLHGQSKRSGKPFLAINCAAIAPTLLESALFGHAKGAFTGASGARAGYFEEALDGTLFLDEIGELPLELQPKLLRVLENGEFQRVGETQRRVSRARIIAATNRDLRREVREGRFRADLYHRLGVFTINVPPLREMGDDRLLLLKHYAVFFARQAKLPPFSLDAEATDIWRSYAFPGNVRELRNIVIRLTAKYPGETIGPASLENELDLQAATTAHDEESADRRIDIAEAARRRLAEREPFVLDAFLQEWEQAYIDAAMERTHGNVSQAAKLLGVNRTTLYNRMGFSGKQEISQ